jgi:HTH-type transcriptional regulator/antitoxin MqsA
MVWKERPTTVQYQGHQATVKATGWWCTSCGEGILAGKELLVRERAFKELKATVDGVLGPDEVAKLRQAIGLSQRKAGKILGGGLRAFQKYESGQAAVSTAMSHLLRLLAADPKLLSQLGTSVAKPAPKPRASRHSFAEKPARKMMGGKRR